MSMNRLYNPGIPWSLLRNRSASTSRCDVQLQEVKEEGEMKRNKT